MSAAVGARAKVMAAPGYPTELLVEIVSVSGRSLAARSVHYSDVPVTYTLRKNGKWAEKGRGQWQMYLRFEPAQTAPSL